jgi:hypothetical protein
MLTITRCISISLCLLLGACEGEGEGGEESVLRLPLVYAPLDTLRIFESYEENDSGIVTNWSDIGLGEPAWLTAELDGLPSPKELTYVRYENRQYGFSFAYPDTLFEVVQPIGAIISNGSTRPR